MAASPCQCRLDVVAAKGPADQAAAGDAVDSIGTGVERLRLLGIWSDDLQIRPGAERKQSVVGSLTQVLAAPTGLNTEALLDVGNSGIEIRVGVDNVVDLSVSILSKQVDIPRDPAARDQLIDSFPLTVRMYARILGVDGFVKHRQGRIRHMMEPPRALVRRQTAPYAVSAAMPLALAYP